MTEYKYYIKKIYRRTHDVIALELGDIKGGPVFSFRPGQYVMISYRNAEGRISERHSFSIASSPTDKRRLDFGIKVQGEFTQGLARLKKGDVVFVTGPFGNFVFDENTYHNLVMIAGGIGITPFMSTLRYATAKGLGNRLSLLYSARTTADFAYFEEIENLAAKNRHLRVLFSVTQEKTAAATNIINGRLDSSVIENFVGSVRGKSFFLCGPKGFMDAMKNNLISLGADKTQIIAEEFSMIPDDGIWLPLRNMIYAGAVAAVLLVLAFNLVNYTTTPAAAGSSGNGSALGTLNPAGTQTDGNTLTTAPTATSSVTTFDQFPVRSFMPRPRTRMS